MKPKSYALLSHQASCSSGLCSAIERSTPSGVKSSSPGLPHRLPWVTRLFAFPTALRLDDSIGPFSQGSRNGNPGLGVATALRLETSAGAETLEPKPPLRHYSI